MTKTLTASKISVSIPADLFQFLQSYQEEHEVSRSEVIAKGLKKLKEQELARAYKEHAEEWQNDPDRLFWDSAAIDDGLDSEESTW